MGLLASRSYDEHSSRPNRVRGVPFFRTASVDVRLASQCVVHYMEMRINGTALLSFPAKLHFRPGQGHGRVG